VRSRFRSERWPRDRRRHTASSILDSSWRFPRCRLRPESLNLVTCFQTFEHLADPLAMCGDAFHLLKPGGAVLFVGHNRRAVSARILGRRSPIFDIEHLQLFSPASVRRMVTTGRLCERGGRLDCQSLSDSLLGEVLPLPADLKRIDMTPQISNDHGLMLANRPSHWPVVEPRRRILGLRLPHTARSATVARGCHLSLFMRRLPPRRDTRFFCWQRAYPCFGRVGKFFAAFILSCRRHS
jgi:hypothetical protein